MDGAESVGIGDKVELHNGGLCGIVAGVGSSFTGELRFYVKWSFNESVSGPIHGGLFRKTQANDMTVSE